MSEIWANCLACWFTGFAGSLVIGIVGRAIRSVILMFREIIK